MADKHIYDHLGRYQGTVSDNPPGDGGCTFTFLILFHLVAVFCAVLLWLWEMADSWSSLERPYNLVAFYYHYLFQLPLELNEKVWVFGSTITMYPRINIILAIALCITYTIFALMLWTGLPYIILKVLKIPELSSIFYLGPAIFALIYFCGTYILLWISQGISYGIGWLFAH